MSALSNSPNYFLSSLSSEDAALLQPHIKLVDLRPATVLYKAEDVIKRVYFPYTGIVSFVVSVSNGAIVEAGVVGRNSAVGISTPLDGTVAINEAIVQAPMSAAAIDAGIMKRFVAEREPLRVSCARHEGMTLVQVQQVAACNALHNLEQRLTRWLLQARDLLNSDLVPLTQDTLSQMLGVNRSSVTLAARRLQEAGLIDYHRGHIQLLDSEALKCVSCECYAAINALFFRLTGWSPSSQ